MAEYQTELGVETASPVPYTYQIMWATSSYSCSPRSYIPDLPDSIPRWDSCPDIRRKRTEYLGMYWMRSHRDAGVGGGCGVMEAKRIQSCDLLLLLLDTFIWI